jgi:hypothetical protein
MNQTWMDMQTCKSSGIDPLEVYFIKELIAREDSSDTRSASRMRLVVHPQHGDKGHREGARLPDSISRTSSALRSIIRPTKLSGVYEVDEMPGLACRYCCLRDPIHGLVSSALIVDPWVVYDTRSQQLANYTRRDRPSGKSKAV